MKRGKAKITLDELIDHGIPKMRHDLVEVGSVAPPRP